MERIATNAIAVSVALFPANAKPGDACELIVTLDIENGWHVNANPAGAPFLIPTQVEVQGRGVEIVDIAYPEPLRKTGMEGETLWVYEGLVHITVRLRLEAKEKNARRSKR